MATDAAKLARLLRDEDLRKQVCDLDVGYQTAIEVLEWSAAALDAAAAVRAEAGMGGMEIIRAVALIGLFRDQRPDDVDILCIPGVSFHDGQKIGLTPDHVRAARAIVAAAERKEVMPSDPSQPRPNDTAPPTAGPIPEAGAPSLERIARTICCPSGKCRARYAGHDCNWPGEIEEARAVLALFAPSPQPPTPAEGASNVRWARINDEPFEYAIQQGPHGDEFVRLLDGTCLRRAPSPAPAPDVARLVEKLKRYANNIHSVGAQYTLTVDVAADSADALTVQAAEIASLQWERKQLRAAAQQIQEQSDAQAAALAAKEAEWKEVAQENRHLASRIAVLEAALRAARPLIHDYAYPETNDADRVRAQVDAALAGKEPQS